MAVTCGLPVNGAMASAINVLDDIHGGAGQQCMELYREIDAEAGEAAISSTAPRAVHRSVTGDAGEKIVPGFGHRFHPRRSAHARRCSRWSPRPRPPARSADASRRSAARSRPPLSDREAATIPMNIDGVTAVIYCELGFEPELGRGLFILSRSVGILAHAWEQKQQGGRIKGPMPKEIPYRYSGPARRAARADADVAIARMRHARQPHARIGGHS